MIVGRIYVVHTVLARPNPKEKIVLCICAAEDLFFWVNTKPAMHGIGQLTLAPSEHSALTRPCFLDCSRVTTFPASEIAAAQARDLIAPALAARIVAQLTTSPPKTLPGKHLRLAIVNLSKLT